MDDPSALEVLVQDLMKAIEKEGEVLGRAFNELKQLARDFSSLSIKVALKKLVGILVNGVMGSSMVVVNALLNVLSQAAQFALKFLDTKIHIPVISDILNKIGIPDLSILDLFMWITAFSQLCIRSLKVARPPSRRVLAFPPPSTRKIGQRF